jgi:hypothetical protein
MPTTVTTLLIGSIFIFLTASNVWPIVPYSKKYGMGCKGCHGFGSSLNDVGLTYKKKIDSSGENEPAKQKSAKPGGVKSDTKENLLPVGNLPEVEPEAKVYRLNAENGIPVFTDNPLNTLPVEKKSDKKKIGKNIVQSGAKPRLATAREAQSDKAVKLKPKAATPNLPLPGSSGQPKTDRISVSQKPLPATFEKCMETFLVKQPQPINAEAAMLQFTEAEEACARYAK